VRKRLVEVSPQRVERERECITLVCDIFLQDRHGARLAVAHPVGAAIRRVLERCAQAWRMREARLLSQEAADLDIGIGALLEQPEELDQVAVTIRNR